MFYKIYFIKVKIVHFFYSQSRCGSCLFDENHTMFQCSLCKWFNWKASCIWSQTINPKPNECKILQLLNAKRKLTNSTRAYSIAGGFDTWCKVRKDLGVGQAWTRCTSGHGVRQFLQLSSSILMDQWFKVVQDPPPSWWTSPLLQRPLSTPWPRLSLLWTSKRQALVFVAVYTNAPFICTFTAGMLVVNSKTLLMVTIFLERYCCYFYISLFRWYLCWSLKLF